MFKIIQDVCTEVDADDQIYTAGPFVKSTMTRAFRECLVFPAGADVAVLARQYYDSDQAEPFELDRVIVINLSGTFSLVIHAFDLFAEKATAHLHELGVAAYRRQSDEENGIGLPNAPLELANVRLLEAVKQYVVIDGPPRAIDEEINGLTNESITRIKTHICSLTPDNDSCMSPKENENESTPDSLR
jgi:hypothetical protein